MAQNCFGEGRANEKYGLHKVHTNAVYNPFLVITGKILVRIAPFFLQKQDKSKNDPPHKLFSFFQIWTIFFRIAFCNGVVVAAENILTHLGLSITLLSIDLK